MKLYIIHAGSITNPDKSLLTPGKDPGVPYKFPVSVYLIEHEKGLVLVDLGFNVTHWPDFMKPDAEYRDMQRIDKQILSLGYNISDIKYIVLSHYHIDHCGWMNLFPDPTYIIRRKEARFAWWPPDRSHGWGSYCFPDYEMTRGYDYIEVDEDVDYDIFDDGSIVLIDTKGHTQGHQSIIVTLPNSGKLVLAIDAASLRENLEERIPPGSHIWSKEYGLQSLAKLQKLSDEGAQIIFGHETAQWDSLKKAPMYYD